MGYTARMETPSRKVVVIGGVAGGMSAATRLRRMDERASIVVFERSGYVSFANCGLPYHVGGIITERDDLLLQTPQSLAARFAIDVRVGHEVMSIDRGAKTVTVTDHANGLTFDEPYDQLILSTGAAPFVPDMPGRERALALRTVEDTDRLNAAIHPGMTTAVVIGGGFIGIELAENLVHRGLSVTIVEFADQLLAPLDPEMAMIVEREVVANGVEVLTKNQVVAIGERDVTLADGSTRPADLVVASIGVRPETGLAAAAGLTLGERGGIAVDDQQRTSDPDIFAVGDAVEKPDALDGSAMLVPLANVANRHGRLVADVIAGRDVHARPVQATAIVGVFRLQAAATGWNEKRLRASGRPYVAVHTHPASHAKYYPGAQDMALKLLFDPQTERILGAQGVGAEGVDKRIDVIATAMKGGLRASDLADLELAYAPQFGSAKDPVNMLGFVAENVQTGLNNPLQWHEAQAYMDAGATPLDVRSAEEFAEGALPGAVNIPVDELRARLDEVPDGPILIYCLLGIRGHIAARILAHNGYTQVRGLAGGIRTWDAGMEWQRRSLT